MDEPLIAAFNEAVHAYAVKDGKVNLTEVMVAAGAPLVAYMGQVQPIEERRQELNKLVRYPQLEMGL